MVDLEIEDKKGLETCKELLRAERVNFIAKANYQKDTELDKLIKVFLNSL